MADNASPSLLHDPRPFRPCWTCGDCGMIESGGSEDVCPTCEGGLWRERIPWRVYLNRLRLPFGLRLKLWNFPYIYRDWPA